MKPNSTYKKSKITFLLLAFFMFAATIGYSQTEIMATPNEISSGATASCTSNAIEIGTVFLGTSTGVPISNCDASGFNVNDVYLWIDIDKASSKYGLYVEFKLLIDGVQSNLSGGVTSNLIAVKQANVSPTESKIIDRNINYRVAKLPYTCGASFELKDIYIAWGENNKVLPGQNNGPHCDGSVKNITVDGPLVANFKYPLTCNDITVTTSVTGGKIYNGTIANPVIAPYTFVLNYGDSSPLITVKPILYSDPNSSIPGDEEFLDYTFGTHSYPINNTLNAIPYRITLTATDTANPPATSTKTHDVTIYPKVSANAGTAFTKTCTANTTGGS
ncbi:hypothetical protein CXF59_02415, partial [Flavobacterium sp. ALD4]|uniref:hypothetical protein n=1 Tax=Flavobacterium sp. ALD4 TaxID=2058314 RepID=UPI000CBA12A2